MLLVMHIVLSCCAYCNELYFSQEVDQAPVPVVVPAPDKLVDRSVAAEVP